MRKRSPDKMRPPKIRICEDKHLSLNRTVLRLIGKPRNIQFWWSEHENMLLVGGSDARTPQSFSVPDFYYDNSHSESLKISRKRLIDMIFSRADLDNNYIYTVYGSYIPGLNMVGFKVYEADLEVGIDE